MTSSVFLHTVQDALFSDNMIRVTVLSGDGDTRHCATATRVGPSPLILLAYRVHTDASTRPKTGSQREDMDQVLRPTPPAADIIQQYQERRRGVSAERNISTDRGDSYPVGTSVRMKDT